MNVTTLVAVTAVVLGAGTGGAKMSNDREDVERMHKEFAEAWSKGDAAKAAAQYTEDGVRVGAMGDTQHGRKEIEDAYRKLFSERFKGAKVTMPAGQFRMLGDGYALWEAPLEIAPADGKPPIKGYALDVMKKVGGQWLILESHPKLYPPMPPAAK